jgi:hypothetical protein
MKTLVSLFAFLLVAMLASADDWIARSYGVTPGGGTGTNIFKMYVNQDVSGAELIEAFVWGMSTNGTVTVSRVAFNGAYTNTVATLTNTPNASTAASISSANAITKMWKDEDYFVFSGAGTNSFRFGAIMRVYKAD